MPGNDKATRRVVAVIVLLVVAAAALRGYLPGGERTPREEATGSSASQFVIVAMLSVSIAIIAIAVITRPRRPKPAGATGEPPRVLGEGSRPTRRVVLIGLAVIVAWLIVVFALSRLDAQLGIDQPVSGPESSTAQPGDGSDPPQEPPRRETGADAFSYLAGATVILLLLTVVGTAIAARRRAGQPQIPVGDAYLSTAPAPESESLARAAELGLAEAGDLSREPREAIIACYAAMERELEKSPGAVPLDSDTPSEVLARAVESHALHADSATELVDLFEEARFSPHVMTEEHREVAVRVLQLVLAEMRSVA